MSKPINPAPARGPRNGELPAYVSNGLIGLRVREMPLMAGMAIVNGLVGEHPERRVEAAAAAPYPLAAELGVDGVWLGDQPWGVTDLVQTYDFATGELTSAFRFQAGDTSLAVEVVTFASRTAPALVLQEIAVTPDRACDLTIRAATDLTGLRGDVVRRRTDTPGEPEPVCDGTLLWRTAGGLSTCGLALWTELLDAADAERSVCPWDAQGPLTTAYTLRARGGRTVRLRQIVAMLPSLVHARPDEEAARRVARGRKTGFDALRARNRHAWAELWNGRIVVHGATAAHQGLIDAAFYYLMSSVHPASPSATSIFGLATWHDYHYYFGHVMWDIDAFCVPAAHPAPARRRPRPPGLPLARPRRRALERPAFRPRRPPVPLGGRPPHRPGGDPRRRQRRGARGPRLAPRRARLLPLRRHHRRPSLPERGRLARAVGPRRLGGQPP